LSKIVTSFQVVPLSPKQLQALTLIGRGDSPKSAALALGISCRTIYRWLTLPEFQDLTEQISSQTRSLTVEGAAESFQKEQQIWQIRREELRSQEWQISQLLLKKARKALENLEISGRIQNIANAIKIGSELGRASSELWSSDLNAAISLVRQYGFDVVDVSIENNAEADESEH
jgi:predicted DNA-binding ribbon-helix-helix protein